MLLKKILTIKNLILMILMVLFAGSAESFAQTRRPVLRKGTTVHRAAVASAPRLFSLPAGTRFRARINESLSSKTARIGQTFTANVVEPVYFSSGAVLVP